MSKLRQRLQKIGSAQSAINKGKTILEETIDNTLKEVMKEAAKEIRVPYDEEIFTLSLNEPKYINVKNNLDILLDNIEKIAEN